MRLSCPPVRLTLSALSGLMRLLRLLLTLVTTWHMLACAYWAVSRLEGFCEYGIDEHPRDSSGASDPYNVLGGTELEPNGFTECSGSSWAPYVGLHDYSLQTQYSAAFFWAVMTTTGVGRDVAPQTDTQIGFTIVVICMGLLLNAFIIGSISTAVATLDATSIKRAQRMESVNSYLTSKNLPSRLRYEIQECVRASCSACFVALNAIRLIVS